MSESGVQNGFIVASSVSDGMGRNTLSERGRYTGTFRSRTVQNMRGGCPKWFYCSVVRIGRHGAEYPLRERGRYNGTFCSRTVQNMRGGCPKWVYCSVVRIGRHGSEYPLRERALHRNIPLKDTPESRSRDVQNGFIVAPSVSDGKIGTPLSERGRYTGTFCTRTVQNVQNGDGEVRES